MMEKMVRRRTEEIRVKLSPSLSEEFSSIASGLGLLPATLAAVALGQYVERYRRDSQLSRMVAMDASKRMVEMAQSPEFLQKAMAGALQLPGMIDIISKSGSGDA